MSWNDLLEQLPADPDRETEIFYAHLALRSQKGTDEELLEELLASLPLSKSTRAHLREQKTARLFIYRSLIRNTLRSVIEKAIPRTVARLEDSFPPLFDAFLAHAPISSHCLRDVTPSFMQFLRTRGHAIEDFAPYLEELAELEVVRIQVAARPDALPEEQGELDLERGLITHPSVQLLSFRYAVHLLSEDPESRELPEETRTELLSYRDPDNSVRYLELSPVAAQMLKRLVAEKALGASLVEACEAENQALDESVLSGSASLLADLAERGVVLGAR